MFQAQGAYRRQAVAGAVVALLDAFAEGLGELDIELHDSLPGRHEPTPGPVQMIP
ncbi:hypothetical protein D3C80_2073220 [compost metagenome]